MKFLNKIFGGGNQRELARLDPLVQKINGLEQEIKRLPDSQLKDKTAEFKKRMSAGDSLNDLLPEALAVVREAAHREIGQRHFDVQLVGGIVLH